MKYRFLFSLFLLLFVSKSFAWDVGDRAYIYNGFNSTQGKKVFAIVEIDDIRGNKAKIVVKGACEDNGWAGKRCDTGWFMRANIRQKDETGWVSLNELLTSWEDKVHQ
jgi:hypothetical protein